MSNSENKHSFVHSGRRFVQACSSSCQRLLARLENAKNAVLNEFRQSFGIQERLLRLALNEAEALAWETEFPLLVFPTLAQEKAQAVVAWNQHQGLLLQASERRARAGAMTGARA